MRVVFIGAGTLAMLTAQTLVSRDHEVVILSHRDNLKALQQRWGLHAGKD